MSNDLKDKWNERYQLADAPGKPTEVLAQNIHLLPEKGTALDLACGLGADAILLAQYGLDTSAWDNSDVVIEKLIGHAKSIGVTLYTEVRDVQLHPPEPGAFDVIVVSHFLERSLTQSIMDALKPEGLLFYQTFTRTRVDNHGPSNNVFRLAENELLDMFAPLLTVLYREEGLLGDTSQGFRNEAMYIGAKRQ